MTAVEKLVRAMARLRGPAGCPWDREQTHKSLKRQLLEETYELLEAIDSDDPTKIANELGDLLLHVVFHSQLAAERGDFDLEAVADRIVAKLVHRHPHVFGDTTVRDSDEVLQNWEQLKAEEPEAGDRTSVLDGVPRTLPALMRAAEMQKRAARVGFDWEDATGPLAKVEEELGELRAARADGGQAGLADEIGDLLFAVVNVSRFCGLDPEEALRGAIDKFCRRFERIEQSARRSGRSLQEMSLQEMDAIWEEGKAGR
ncbi:MAG: nucleoside triphosphate pyrophosphohydrolase [Armatimonadota bacterium]